MRTQLDRMPGIFILFAIVVGPGTIVSWLLHDAKWMLRVSGGIVLLLLVIAALPTKRRITPQQLATELEQHLLGTEGPHDWNDAISVRLADKRLDRLCRELWKFNDLSLPDRREELKEVIAALRRGEVPDIKYE